MILARRTGIAPALFPLAMLFVGAVSLVGMLRHLTAPFPLDPWEAGLVVEGWRAARGLPVYEALPAGHATHFHGALVPWIMAGAEYIVGVSVRTGRYVTLVSTLLVVTMLSWASHAAAPRRTTLRLAGAALLLGVQAESVQYLVRGRSDMWAVAIGVLALVILFVSEARRSFGLWSAGALLMVGAMFIKQPLAMLSGIPLVAALLGSRERTALARGITLPALLMVAAVILRVTQPVVFHTMFVIPAAYRVTVGAVVASSVYFLSHQVLLFVIVALHLAVPQLSDTATDGERRTDLPQHSTRSAAQRWALAAIIVTVPVCALLAGKGGAIENSWLPAWFALLFFTLLRLPSLDALLSDESLGAPRRIAMSGLLAGAAVCSFPLLHRNLFPLVGPAGYEAVVAEVAALPGGRVSAPQDNLLVLRARGIATRSLVQELDAAPTQSRWMSAIPSGVRAELDSAQWVVVVDDWFPSVLNADSLRALQFEKSTTIGQYSIWRRPPSAP